MNHEELMKKAIILARRGLGYTSPNPMVGAVIAKNGKIVGEGWHKKAGMPHAEVEAIRDAGGNTHGADLYVNLEPCSHFGRTPPCANAIVEAGIKRVFAGITDPNPKVSGKGFDILIRNGIEVVSGLLKDECLKLNESFIKVMKTGIPFITAKAAMTLDGKIASHTGDSKWISCEESRLRVHRLRSIVDAVVVGGNTALKDNPSLNCRLPEKEKIKDPVRVVFDTHLDISLDSKIVANASDGKTIIFSSITSSDEKRRELEKKGCSVEKISSADGVNPDPAEAMKALAGRGIQSVLLEGGGELIYSFMKAGLVDRFMIFIAPKIIGGRQAKTFMEGEGISSIKEAVRLMDLKTENSGEDILISADVVK